MSITLIAALSENYCIGKDNTLPWHIPEDLKHFQELTVHKAILMGKKTYASLPKKPLPKRLNIVMTHDMTFPTEDNLVSVHSLEEAIDICQKQPETYIIGGATVYKQFMPYADTMELTKIHRTVDGDTFFPRFKRDEWYLINEEDHGIFSYLSYRRK
jgi:dihydrofolate reductase